MEAISIKNILSDRVKLSHVIAFSILAVFAYILLVKIDGGNFARIDSALRKVNENLVILRYASGYKAYLSEFDSNYVTDKDANWLIDILTNLAADADVRINSLKPVSGAAISDYRIRSVSAEGEASYNNLLRFIRKIENYEMRLFIERLTMAKEPGAGLIRFELVLSFLSVKR